MEFAAFSMIHFVIIFFAFNVAIFEAQELPKEEVNTLRRIFSELGHSEWVVKPDLCRTSMVEMEPRHKCDCSFYNHTMCHVSEIRLSRLNLTGELPRDFANLKYLSIIDLTYNKFRGPIPIIWASLPLRELILEGNFISGRIPRQIGNVTTLRDLILNDNLMDGILPRELGNLRTLQRVLLSGNNFNGTLPATFANLTNLMDFRISGTSISGKIPMFIGNWRNLQKIHMLGTNMKGPIPITISSLANLTELMISDLNLANVAFPDLQNLSKLNILVLRNCSLVGQIPEYIGHRLKYVTNLDLSFNRLSGAIPQSLVTGQLKYLYLTNNSLTGDVSWLSNTESQRYFDISYNNFTGNDTTACHTRTLNNISSLSSVDDKSIGWCFKKDLPCPSKPRNYNLFINCGGPDLQVGKDQYEQDLDPMGPTSFISRTNWGISTTGNFLNLLADNYVIQSSDSEDKIYSSARVSPISLRYYGLCLQEGSYEVKLHFAEIMLEVGNPGRRVFDVFIQGDQVLKDFNIAEEAGGIGKEIIKQFNNITVRGSTLEIHLYWSGKGTMGVPIKGVYGPLISGISISPNFDTGADISPRTLSIIIFGSCAAVIFLLLVILKVTGIWRCTFSSKEFIGLHMHTSYTLKQIEVATANFAESNKIGQGGFGTVYKGELPDGSLIAVKQLSIGSRQGKREFLYEVGLLSTLQHPNLVKLHGSCTEGNQLMLVYEYLEKNSLSNALFGSKEKRIFLDWKTRFDICLGIARGLAYLHEEASIRIVHRDIKGGNVLLGKKLTAKISDFGLAKLHDVEKKGKKTTPAGTLGYVAPELFNSTMPDQLTTKADVYSFGIVILEVVSGEEISRRQTSEEYLSLVDQALGLKEKGRLIEFVDRNLNSKFHMEDVLKMLEIGILCTNKSSDLRPTMSSIVSMLEGKIQVAAPSLSSSRSMSCFRRLYSYDKMSFGGSIRSSQYSDQESQNSEDFNHGNQNSRNFDEENHTGNGVPLVTDSVYYFTY